MLLQLTHETRYQYTPVVDNADHVLRLSPPSSHAQTVLQHHLSISPEPSHQRHAVDVFGNSCQYFSLQSSHEFLSVTAHSTVRTHAPVQALLQVPLQVHGFKPPPWELVQGMFRYQAGAAFNGAWEFLFASPYVPRHDAFTEFARPSFAVGRPLPDAAHDLMRRIHSAMTYDDDSTDVNTPALVALQQGKGVCQDFAHIMVACCRAMGLPARYVSGYMLTQPPPGQTRLIGCDASHAWASVYCPHSSAANGNQAGQWLDFDPTNNRVPGEDYVTLATGRDFLDVSPLRGVIRGGAQHELRVAVTVMPIDDMPESSL